MSMTRESGNGASVYLGAVLGLHVALLTVTFFRYQIWQAPGPYSLLGQLNLTSENNLASWWSGMLLLLIAFHSFDGFQRFRSSNRRAAHGWLALAAITLILSADEVGSLHERSDAWLRLGTWTSLIPFAAILLALLAVAVFSFLRAGEERRTLLPILVGIALFGLVAVQEALEHRFEWSGWLASVRGVVEEGTELAGIWILLGASARNTGGRPAAGAADAIGPSFEAVSRPVLPMLLVALVAATLCIPLALRWPNPQLGSPTDWLAAALFLTAGLAALRPWLRRETELRRSPAMIAVVAAASSAACVALDSHLEGRLAAFTGILAPKSLLLAGGSLAILFLSVPFARQGHGREWTRAALWVGLSASALLLDPPLSGIIAPIAFGAGAVLAAWRGRTRDSLVHLDGAASGKA